MNDFVEAIILGIVQGLTEFLPVSSSGHLEIAKWLLGDDAVAEQSMLMTVMLHGATALATVVVFWKDILDILKGLFKKPLNEQQGFALKIIISMIPAAIVGVFFEDIIESMFSQRILFVGAMLLITAVLLYLADKAKNTDREVSYIDAIWIGVAQAIAIIPGISRSGATISTSVLLGIDRSKAARFSFLMVVPLILGKILKDIIGGEIISSQIDLPSLGIGFLAAFTTGIFACKWMIVLVKQAQLKWFALYCVIVGIFIIGWMLINP